jgi:hypothetical protein
MAGSTNFKVFNQNLTNMMDDNTYNTSGYRLNGAVSGLAPSNIHNKLYYQVTTMVTALAQSLANRGYAVSDDNFNNLVTVLSNIALKTDNVASATKLQTARKINNVTFDGSADINLTPANIGALPSDTTVATGDWNSYINNGFYYGLNLANAPTSGSASWYWVQTIRYADNYVYQQAHGFGGSSQVSWERTQNLGVWSIWKQIATTDQLQIIRGLKIQVTDNNNIALTADYNPFTQTNIGLTLNAKNSGANGLDTGVVASSWYSVWLIFNPTLGIAGLLSASAVPTLPNGYTQKIRLGWVRTDSSGNLLRTLQRGRHTQYVATPSTNTASMPIMASGRASNYTAISVSGFVPPTALKIDVHTAIPTSAAGSSSFITVAPNAAYGTSGNIANPPLIDTNVTQNNTVAYHGSGQFVLESSNIFYTCNGSDGVIFCSGWEDDI